MTIHIHKAINKLKDAMLQMGTKVEGNFKDAIRLVENYDPEKAKGVYQSDQEINELEIELEEECLKVLALNQPVAVDLRCVVAILKINNELERISDLTANIVERSADLASFAPFDLPIDLWTMADKVLKMLSKSLDSMLSMNSKAALVVLTLDDEVDAMHREVYRIIKEKVQNDPDKFDFYICFPSISRYLERIADLASNIAEDVIYLVEGEIVRHRSLTEVESDLHLGEGR